MTLFKYPFLPKLVEKYSGIPISELSAREINLAKERVIESIRRGLVSYPSDYEENVVSYILAMIIVASIGDQYLRRRYSLAEAKTAYRYLKDEEDILEVAREIGVDVKERNRGSFTIPLWEYLKLSKTIRDERWKLVNRTLINGNVLLSRREVARLLMEKIRSEIEEKVSIKVENIPSFLENWVSEIKLELEKRKKSEFKGRIGGRIPPCMIRIMERIKSGENVSHQERFAITSYLIGRGKSVEEVISLFSSSPDFDEKKTRYQVLHISGEISGKRYSPPSCDKMRTFGLCYMDEGCKGIRNPLQYRGVKIDRERRSKKQSKREG